MSRLMSHYLAVLFAKAGTIQELYMNNIQI